VDLISDTLFIQFVGMIFVVTLIKAGQIYMGSDPLFEPLEYMTLILLWPVVFAITVKVLVQDHIFD
jgi:hypothetical protein